MIDLSVEMTVGTVKWKRAFPRMKVKIQQAATLAFAMAKKPRAFNERNFEISILLSTDAKIKKLNAGYRAKDKPTNVLSFPQFDLPSPAKALTTNLNMQGTDAVSLGDVILAFETIKREGKEQEKTLENHTIHLVVHGVLHLLGYDHMSAKEAKAMEKLECDILEVLGYPNPYDNDKHGTHD